MSFYQSILHLLASAAVLILTSSILHCEEPPAATLSLQGIRTAAMDRADSIRNVRVEYDYNWKKLLNVPSFSSMHGDLTPYHVDFAFDGERRYLDLKATDTLPKGAPRRQHKVVLFDGQRSYAIDKDTLAMVSVIEGKERTCEDLEIYCHNVLLIPYRDQDRIEENRSIFYPYCLQKIRGRYLFHVLPKQDLVDDHWCHVLECPGYEKLWVDPSIGCAIRKRERYTKTKGKPLLFQRHHSFRFIEGASGILVPTKFTGTYFAGPDDPPEFLGRPYLELILSVSRVSVNKVTDADFNVPLKPGTIVVGKQGSYRIKGDKAILLNELADVAKERSERNPVRPRRMWLLFLGLPLLLTVVCYMLWRTWRGRSSRTQPPPGQAT